LDALKMVRPRGTNRAADSFCALPYRRVIAGLDPAIHDEVQRATSLRSDPLHGLMDARVKPGHDAERSCPKSKEAVP
jgi:hypothetical protein